MFQPQLIYVHNMIASFPRQKKQKLSKQIRQDTMKFAIKSESEGPNIGSRKKRFPTFSHTLTFYPTQAPRREDSKATEKRTTDKDAMKENAETTVVEEEEAEVVVEAEEMIDLDAIRIITTETVKTNDTGIITKISVSRMTIAIEGEITIRVEIRTIAEIAIKKMTEKTREKITSKIGRKNNGRLNVSIVANLDIKNQLAPF